MNHPNRSAANPSRTRVLASKRTPLLAAFVAAAFSGCSMLPSASSDGLTGETVVVESEEVVGVDELAAAELGGSSARPGFDSADPESKPDPELEPRGLAVVDEADSVLVIIKDHPDLTTFAALIANYPQQQVFTQARGLTLFAPSDAAFEAMDPEFADRLGDDLDAFTLFLSAHMAIGHFSIDALTSTRHFSNALAQQHELADAGGVLTVGSAEVRFSDLTATNGVVHVIDGTLDT